MKVLFVQIAFVAFLFSCDGNKECDTELSFDINRDRLAADLILIDDYLDDNDLVAQTDPSGIRYTIIRRGEGTAPEFCSSVTIIYEGRILETDEVFFESESPTTAPLSSLIPGFQIGIPKVNSGGRIILYVPSGLGYAEDGLDETVPPNSILILDVTVESID